MDPTAADLGPAPASLATGRMVLWLRRSPDQQAHLSQFLSQAQDPNSASYRRWLTPEAYGAAYGISDHDLAAVTDWLQASGLTVESVPPTRNAILFSGTAGSLASAFHTSIHSYTVGQQWRYANTTDPEIPTALAPVIAAVSPINNFRPRPLHVLGKGARWDGATRRPQPAMNGGDATNGYSLYVTPADAAIIYDTPNKNFNPAAKQTLDGSGVTVGIIGYSALAMADVQNYRAAFLPPGAARNLPHQILDGGIDPGIIEGSYASEALLDVEIAGGLAPGAAINYYYAASTDLSDGLILAGLRALEDNQVNVLSVSYGQCEADLGLGGNVAWSELWQQAAAQGIAVTVSTGDSGTASCDGDTSVPPIAAARGLSVSGLASTPYDIAVGGTDFYPLLDSFSTYVNTSGTGSNPYYATALGYIPENPWNDSSTVVSNSFTQNLPTYDFSGNTNIIGDGGGLSSEAVCTGSTNADGSCSQSLSGYPQPAFQTAFQQSKPVRSIPDVSLLSANGFYGAAWIFCSDSNVDQQGGVYTDCQLDANGHLTDASRIGLIGGTSAAAPAFAGMLAMISQSQGGARLGQANAILYNLAQDYNASSSSPGKYQRAFHDITVGNNSVYCDSGSPDCASNNFLEGYNATPSYDMATGLGSVDLSQLISLWNTTKFASTTATLTAGISSDTLATAPITVVHGTPLSFAAAVTPGDATGQFSIFSTNKGNSTSYSDYGTLDSNGIGNLTTSDLPGGAYTVYAYYAGDTDHIGTQSSNSIDVTISPESSTTTLSFSTYDPTTNLVSEGISTVGYGMHTFVNAQPFGNSSTVGSNGYLLADGIATGGVTFKTGDGKTQSAAINSVGTAQLSVTSLSPGTYSYQASYAGDASFSPSASSQQTLTVTKGLTSFQLQPSAVALNPVGQVTLTAILQTDSIGLFPTGSVSAEVNGHTYPPALATAVRPNGVDANLLSFTIPASDLVPASNLVSVSYGGDSNYLPANGSVSITLAGATGSYTLAGPAKPLVIQASQQTSSTVSVTPANGFTGLLTMTCTVSAAPSGHAPVCQAAPTTVYDSSGATSVLSVASYADTPVGSYTINVTGTNGVQSQSVQIPLQVTDGPGFTLSASDASLSIAAPGQTATDTLSIAPTQGFSGTVVLTCAVVPAPSTGKPPACTVPATVVVAAEAIKAPLVISTDEATPPGSYTVAITALSGALQQALAVPLVEVPLPASPTFGLTAAAKSVSVATAGESVTDLLSLRPAGGFTGTVQLSCAVQGSSPQAAPTCAVPDSASITGPSVVNATLTINTVAGSTAAASQSMPLSGERLGGVMLGCLLLVLIPKRRTWTSLGFVLLAVVALTMSACGGGHPSATTGGSPGTPAGSYTVTITAVSNSIQATTQIDVAVQGGASASQVPDFISRISATGAGVTFVSALVFGERSVWALSMRGAQNRLRWRKVQAR